MKTNFSLKARAALGVTLMTVLVVVLVSALQMHKMRRDLSRVFADAQLSVATRVAGELDAKFTTYTEVLEQSGGRLPHELLADPARLRAYYAARPALLALFDDLLVVLPNGQVVADLPEKSGRAALNIAARPYFQRLLATRKPVISEPIVSRIDGAPIVQIAAPILTRDGRVAAVLLGVIRLTKSNFLADLASAKNGKTGYFVLMTRGADPVYVIHPDRSRILQPRVAAGARSTTAALAGYEGTAQDTNSVGVPSLFSYKLVKAPNWLLVATIPVAEVYAPIDAAAAELWRLCLAVCLLLIPLVWAGAWALLTPLTQLRDRMNGVLGAPARDFMPLPAARADEIGDITRSFNAVMAERAAAEAQAAAVTQRLRLLTDNLPAMVSYIDADLQVRFLNRGYKRWHKLPEDDPGVHDLRTLLGEARYTQIEPQVREVMAGKLVRFQRQLREDGRPVWVDGTYVPDFGPGGRVVGFYTLLVDITRLKQTEAVLEASNENLEARVARRTAALEKANAELETFAYSVAHVFRAPLRAVENFGALLVEECGTDVSPQGHQYVERMRDASTRAARLLDDLLRLASIPKRLEDSAAIDLSEVTGFVVAQLQAGGAARTAFYGVPLPVRAAPAHVDIEPGMRVQGNPALVRMLMAELLDNACKFSAGHVAPAITVGTTHAPGGSDAGGWHTCYVTDNGTGFEMAYADKLFKPFERMHGADEYAGSGVGLAIAKSIVEIHGGRIWVEAVPGQGTTIWFTLPRA